VRQGEFGRSAAIKRVVHHPWIVTPIEAHPKIQIAYRNAVDQGAKKKGIRYSNRPNPQTVRMAYTNKLKRHEQLAN
jgi:hypothetical protein